MRTNRQGGFTLIELLIVIAIIGILAAVLIPNLLSARKAAQDRAAQAHSQQVFTAINAVLAEDVRADLPVVGDGLNEVTLDGTALANDMDCSAGGIFTSAAAGNYEVSDPGAAVTTCQIAIVDKNIFVEVTSINHVAGTNVRLYENGQPVTAFTN